MHGATNSDERRERQRHSIGFIPAPAGVCGRESALLEWVAEHPTLANWNPETNIRIATQDPA